MNTMLTEEYLLLPDFTGKMNNEQDPKYKLTKNAKTGEKVFYAQSISSPYCRNVFECKEVLLIE